MLAAALLLATGCATDLDGGAAASDPVETIGTDVVAAPEVRVDGATVLLEVDGAEHEVAELDELDGEAVHAALRPTEGDRHTVLVVTRVSDGPARYELRYATVDVAEEGVSHTDLYWFPWRSQIDESSAAILDVPPVPVWAPDGSGVAWIEWTDDGTRLRTVGWISDDTADNPSELVGTYRLDDVPAGAQLERWLPPEEELDAVLVARGADDARFRIEVEPGTLGAIPSSGTVS
jgi:hypothetical protein